MLVSNIYIYIYICVCVCVCVCYLEQLSNVLIEWLLKCLHILIITFKLFFKHLSRVIIWHLWYMNSSHCFGVNLFLLSIFSCYMGEKMLLLCWLHYTDISVWTNSQMMNNQARTRITNMFSCTRHSWPHIFFIQKLKTYSSQMRFKSMPV